MNARNPTIRPSASATNPKERPNGFSRCFHGRTRRAARPPDRHPAPRSAARSQPARPHRGTGGCRSGGTLLTTGAPRRPVRSGARRAGCRRSRPGGLLPHPRPQRRVLEQLHDAVRERSTADPAGRGTPAVRPGRPPEAADVGHDRRLPRASASIRAIDRPSCSDESANTSNVDAHAGASSRNPMKSTVSSSPSESELAQLPLERPRPDQHEPHAGTRDERAPPRSSRSRRLCAFKFATVPTTGASAGIPSSSRTPFRARPGLDRPVDAVIERLHRRHASARRSASGERSSPDVVGDRENVIS